MEQIQNEISVLRLLLAKERSHRLEVEDERDILMAENHRLTQALERAERNKTIQPSGLKSSEDVHNNDNHDDDGNSILVSGGDPLLANHVDSVALRVENACDGKNVLSVAFLESELGDMLLCGGADGKLTAYSSSSGAKLLEFNLSAPVLSIHTWKHHIACGMMDGSHATVRTSHSFFVLFYSFSH